MFRNYRYCNQFFVLVNPTRYRLARGLNRYERAYERREYLFTSLVIQHHVVEHMRAKARQRPHQVLLLSAKVKLQFKLLFQKQVMGPGTPTSMLGQRRISTCSCTTQ